MRTLRVAVDIGGTFTDLQILDEATGVAHAHKVATTPDDPSEGLIIGIREACARLGVDPGQVSAILHGTTIATNAVLQRRLPAGAVITTDGFADVLEIGRHVRKQVYANRAEPRALLVPRSRRFGVVERVRADGTVEVPLDEESVRVAAEGVRASGATAVAIAFLHGYANPEHELRAAAIVQAALPDAFVSCSHQVSPEIREFERTSTTVLNALLMPVVKTYLSKLEARLADAGIDAPVYLVQSNGGVTTPAIAGEQPARLLLSGPSGGARAAEVLAADLAEPNLIAVDMGGTSYDVSIVHDDAIRLVTQGEVDGLPVRLPMIEIRTIGAGGGSIAQADDTGRLHVGPDSAGAVPGPVCYGRGGEQPTVTDANVALGRIDPGYFLGGAMDLDLTGAARALADRVATPLGLEPGPAAEGVLAVAVARMAAAIRLSLFEKGLDPKDFALISFGGAGGLHACDTATEIGTGRVVFPRDPGTLSAWGMLFGDVVHDLARSRLVVADASAVPVLTALVADLRGDAEALLARDGIAAADRAYPVTLDLRYPGQAYEIGVPLTDPAALADAVSAFHDAHDRQYAHAERHVTPEIVTVRLAATGRLTRPAPRPFAAPAGGRPKGTRRIRVAGSEREAPVWERSAIGADVAIEGPAVVEEPHSTLLVPPGWRLAAHPSGALIATREGA